MADESLSVQITFENAQQVQRQLEDVQKALAGLGNVKPSTTAFDQLAEATTTFTKNIKSISTTPIAPQLDPRSMEELATVAAAIAASMKKVGASGKAAGAGLREAEEEASKAERAMSSLKSAANIVVGSFLGLSAFNIAQKGLAGFTRQLSQAKQLFIDTQAAVLRFASGLQAVGRFSERAIVGIQAYAQVIQNTTGISDDLVIKAAALIAQLGALSGKALTGATDAAIELSKVLGFDLQTAALLVAKAAQGNTTQFQRYGLVIDKNIPKHKRFAALLELVNKKFKGTAELAARGLGGSLDKLAKSWDDLLKAFGSTFAFAQPAIDAITAKFQQWNSQIDNNIDNVLLASDTIDRMIGRLGKLGDAIDEARSKRLGELFELPDESEQALKRRLEGDPGSRLADNLLREAAKDIASPFVSGVKRIRDELRKIPNLYSSTLDEVATDAQRTTADLLGLDFLKFPDQFLDDLKKDFRELEKQQILVFRASGDAEGLREFIADVQRLLASVREKQRAIVGVELEGKEEVEKQLKDAVTNARRILKEANVALPVRIEALLDEEVQDIRDIIKLSELPVTVQVFGETDQFSEVLASATRELEGLKAAASVPTIGFTGITRFGAVIDDFKIEPEIQAALDDLETSIEITPLLTENLKEKFLRLGDTLAQNIQAALGAFDAAPTFEIKEKELTKARALVAAFDELREKAREYNVFLGTQPENLESRIRQIEKENAALDALRQTAVTLLDLRGAPADIGLAITKAFDVGDIKTIVDTVESETIRLEELLSKPLTSDEARSQSQALLDVYRSITEQLRTLVKAYGDAGRAEAPLAGALAGLEKTLGRITATVREFTEMQIFMFNQFANSAAATFQNAWDNVVLGTEDFAKQMLRIVSDLVSSIITEFIRLKVFGLFVSGGNPLAAAALQGGGGVLPLKPQQIPVPDQTAPVVEFSRLLRAQQRQQQQEPIIVKIPEQQPRRDETNINIKADIADGASLRRQIVSGPLRAETARAARRRAL